MQEDELCAELGPARGKGDAMWRALGELDSEIVAFADTDTEEFGEHFLTGPARAADLRAGGALRQGLLPPAVSLRGRR